MAVRIDRFTDDGGTGRRNRQMVEEGRRFSQQLPGTNGAGSGGEFFDLLFDISESHVDDVYFLEK